MYIYNKDLYNIQKDERIQINCIFINSINKKKI